LTFVDRARRVCFQPGEINGQTKSQLLAAAFVVVANNAKVSINWFDERLFHGVSPVNIVRKAMRVLQQIAYKLLRLPSV
jgi:hypothetical protein